MEPIRLPEKICLKGARLLDPQHDLDQTGDLVIENGVITMNGSGKELLKDPHVVEAYLGV